MPAPANLVLAGALAENTRRAYRRAIEDFFCRTGLSLSEVKREDVIQYRNTLMREYSPSTVALRLSVLSQVFEEAKIRGMVEYNPLERQKRPKVSQESTTEGLTEKETAAMLGLTAWAAGQLGIGFGVANCWSAVLGALVINLVSLALTLLIRGKEREKPRRRF